MKQIITKTDEIIIIPILFEIASKALVIKGNSAPALTNCPTTCGKTNASKDIITIIENPINITG